MIQFPKYTNPIGTVSCGVSHVLALTIGGEMYFWGREMTRNFQGKVSASLKHLICYLQRLKM